MDTSENASAISIAYLSVDDSASRGIGSTTRSNASMFVVPVSSRQSLVENEARAYRLMKQQQTYSWKDVRVALEMHCHWVFCVNAKHLPDDGEWIDILYHQIDLPRGWSDCRSINL